MLRFFRESVKEFDHVVWPTHRETTRYFTIVLGVIAVFTVFLAVVGAAFRGGLFGAREIVRPTSSAPAQSAASKAPEIDLSSVVASGATVSTGSQASPAPAPIVVSTGATK